MDSLIQSKNKMENKFWKNAANRIYSNHVATVLKQHGFLVIFFSTVQIHLKLQAFMEIPDWVINRCRCAITKN